MPQRATFKVPRLYKAAAKVVNVIKNENGNLEQLVEQYNKKTNAKALAALVSKALKNESLLDKIVENSQILIKEPKEDPWLFRVLIAELLLGKQRLPIGSNPIQIVLSYGPILRTEFMRAQGKHVGKQNKPKSIEEDPDYSAPEQTKNFEKPKTAESGKGKNTGMKSLKRKRDNTQASVEEDVQHEMKQIKKSKKKRKNNREIISGVNEGHTIEESRDVDEESVKSRSSEPQDYNKLEDDNIEHTSAEHNRKKGERYKQFSKNPVQKKVSSKSEIKSKKKKQKKFQQASVEEDVQHEMKKIKKSKKKRKNNREIISGVNEGHTIEESRDVDEESVKSRSSEPQDYNKLEDDNIEHTSVEHNRKKGKRNKQFSKNPVQKKVSSKSEIKSKKEKQKKFQQSSNKE